MIPKFRAWIKTEKCFADYIESIRFYINEIDLCWGGICESDCFDFEDVIHMQSTGLKDKNGKEIFEGDILKFNDEWIDYDVEGYIDGSIEGINYVVIEKKTTCFTFWKTKMPESMLSYLVNDENLSFNDLIAEKEFEFEVVGNIYQDSGFLEVI